MLHGLWFRHEGTLKLLIFCDKTHASRFSEFVETYAVEVGGKGLDIYHPDGTERETVLDASHASIDVSIDLLTVRKMAEEIALARAGRVPTGEAAIVIESHLGKGLTFTVHGLPERQRPRVGEHFRIVGRGAGLVFYGRDRYALADHGTYFDAKIGPINGEGAEEGQILASEVMRVHVLPE